MTYGRTFRSGYRQDGSADCNCPLLGAPPKQAYSAGISAEWLLSQQSTWRESLVLRAGYRYSELRYDESGDRIPMVTDDGTLVATDIGQTVDIDVTQIEFAFLGKVNLFDTDIEILAGPSAGFSRHALRTQKMHLIPEAKFDTTLFRPGDIEFLDNGTAIVTSKDNISDLYPLRWALQLGTQYDLRFGRLHIIPGIGFIADLTGISPSTLSLRTHQLSGSLDVRWTLF